MIWFKRSALSALIVLPLSALAFGPRHHQEPSTDEIALHLGEKLDLPDGVAAEVAARMVATRTEGEALKERARAEAKALEEAIALGDDEAMKASMKALERIKADGEDLKAALQDDLKSMLSVEQQAMMTLMHLERMQRQGEVMRRVKERMALERGL